MTQAQSLITRLKPGEPFPPVDTAWPPGSPAPGLLAVGGQLDVDTLQRAYRGGIFPWFGVDEPILWWSTDPRMVLRTANFTLHRSLRKMLQKMLRDGRLQIRMDHDFAAVIHACAHTPRAGQSGTWIVPAMQNAYNNLHQTGHAHSVETWLDDRLVAGLYCVSIGRALFGESMFTTVRDGSKMALAALVAWCRHHQLPLIDCQQNTQHLAALGAREIPRLQFIDEISALTPQAAPLWHFEPIYWDELLGPTRAQTPQAS